MSQYEVWCPSCEVSFPLGTKRCVHCGARTASDRPTKAARAAERYSVTQDLRGFSKRQQAAPADAAFVETADFQPVGQAPEEEEEAPRRRGLRAGMSVVWMILLAAGYIWQNCAAPA